MPTFQEILNRNTASVNKRGQNYHKTTTEAIVESVKEWLTQKRQESQEANLDDIKGEKEVIELAKFIRDIEVKFIDELLEELTNAE